MQDRDIIKKLQGYCDKMNRYLPCKSQEDVDALYAIINEWLEEIPGSNFYWSREIYLDSGFDLGKCADIFIHRDCYVVPVDDIEEHLGIKVIYAYEKEK